MNDVPAVHPATAAVRVRAFLEAAARGLKDGDYPFDPRNGRTVISCAPGASGQVVPLYVEDLAALVDDHRGEIDNVRNIQTQPDKFTMRMRELPSYHEQSVRIAFDPASKNDSVGLFQFIPVPGVPDSFELAETPPMGIPVHGRFKIAPIPLTQTKRYPYPTAQELNEALIEQLREDNGEQEHNE